jgi:hypothetical protein
LVAPANAREKQKKTLAMPHLLAESFHDWFNRQPYAQFVAVGLLFLFGLFLLREGRRGIGQGMMRGAWGRVYAGKSARRNGYLFCVIGAAMITYALAFVIVKLL